MEQILEDLAAQHAELDAVLVGLDDAGWATPSRCDGWDVSDVVLHLAQTDELALASVTGTFDDLLGDFMAGMESVTDVDQGAGVGVDRERGAPPETVHARWREASSGLRAALAATDPSTRVPWIVGDMACRTLATTRLAECWIHTEDVTDPLGLQSDPGRRLWAIARLAWRTVPYALAQAGLEPSGPVAFELTAPDGDTWRFDPPEPALTTVTGPAIDLCRVAGQRLDASQTALVADGPDGDAVLRVVRTFA